MIGKKYSLLLFFILLLITSCMNTSEKKLVAYRGLAQGTTFQIKFYSGVDSTMIKNGIDSIFRLIDHTASNYDSNSIISKVNDNREVELNEHFITIFNKSQEVSKATDGFFDITIGPLVKGWGFWRKKGIEMNQHQVDSLKSLVNYQNVSISNGKLVKLKPEITLDFNAIAQGYTNDVISDYLKSKGCSDFLIEIGGEVLANGLKNSKEKWIVGIEKPSIDQNSDQVVQEKIALTDNSLATSGNYRKYIIKDGIKYSHTIDPKTGFPSYHSLLCVTVIADNCTEADAYATAFMVMGKDKAKAFLTKHPEMDAYFISSDSSENFRIEYTKGFNSLIVK